MENLSKPRPYHSISADQTLELLETSREGLSDYEVLGRLSKLGKNILPKEKKFSRLMLFLNQFNSPLMFIIIGAAIASFFVGHLTDSIFIIFVILINTIVGFIQENKAEKALEKLKKSAKFYCRVIREKRKKEILSEDLALGDIVEIQAGDRVPADGRIISSQSLKIDESMLTGEWIGVEKNEKKLDENTEINERSNMIFLGSITEEGKALFIVTATGINTQLGEISKMIKKEKETVAPIQRKFIHLSRLIGVAIIISIAVFATINVFRGEDIRSIFITSIALVVSAVPAGLLPAITVVLILGMRRLARKKALVRKLNSNETMGSVTVICMDKTGTLTQGKMQVSHVLTGGKELFRHNGGLDDIYRSDRLGLRVKVLEIATLVNDAYIENPDDEFSRWIIRGRPTDRALLLAGANAGIQKSKLEKSLSMLKEIPFNSDKKYAVHVYQTGKNQATIYFLGAPEIAVKRSSRVEINGKSDNLTSRNGKELIERVEGLTNQGLRVLACGSKKISLAGLEKYSDDEWEKEINNLHLIGFIALKDPLRQDVSQSIKIAERAGIKPVIITGDHRNTASSVVKELGYEISEDEILEGKDLEAMSDKELEKKAGKVSIFARVLPIHKIRIIRAFQSKGEIVAMVGDGINDAPALKAADVGIAIGSGTDIAKGVSDIILLDNSFSVIVKAIEQGRLIVQNIRRVIIYLMADDFSELFLFFSAIALGLPFPLYPIQILWINLVEDGFPDIALTTEKDTKGLMREKPRGLGEPILNRAYKKFMMAVFFVSGLAALGTFYFALKYFGDLEKTRTLVFALIAFDSLIFAFIVRSFKHSVFSSHIFSNKFLNGAILISLVFLLSGIYFPPFQKLLQVVPLGIGDWGIILGVSLIELFILEALKFRFLIRNKK